MIQEGNEATLISGEAVSRRIMAAYLALIATVLTSFLPIVNKHLLRDARPALVAWITNAASLLAYPGGGNAPAHAVLDYLAAWKNSIVLHCPDPTH